jgi:hypothetical protein
MVDAAPCIFWSRLTLSLRRRGQYRDAGVAPCSPISRPHHQDLLVTAEPASAEILQMISRARARAVHAERAEDYGAPRDSGVDRSERRGRRPVVANLLLQWSATKPFQTTRQQFLEALSPPVPLHAWDISPDASTPEVRLAALQVRGR